MANIFASSDDDETPSRAKRTAADVSQQARDSDAKDRTGTGLIGQAERNLKLAIAQLSCSNMDKDDVRQFVRWTLDELRSEMKGYGGDEAVVRLMETYGPRLNELLRVKEDPVPEYARLLCHYGLDNATQAERDQFLYQRSKELDDANDRLEDALFPRPRLEGRFGLSDGSIGDIGQFISDRCEDPDAERVRMKKLFQHIDASFRVFNEETANWEQRQRDRAARAQQLDQDARTLQREQEARKQQRKRQL
jgi:hypothetical protein